MIEEHLFALTFLLGVVVGVGLMGMFATSAAYRNGCTEGFGFAVEPWNEGYREAGMYLKKHMAHRWPELRRHEPHQPNGFFHED